MIIMMSAAVVKRINTGLADWWRGRLQLNDMRTPPQIVYEGRGGKMVKKIHFIIQWLGNE
jgi:hypothetical protein